PPRISRRFGLAGAPRGAWFSILLPKVSPPDFFGFAAAAAPGGDATADVSSNCSLKDVAPSTVQARRRRIPQLACHARRPARWPKRKGAACGRSARLGAAAPSDLKTVCRSVQPVRGRLAARQIAVLRVGSNSAVPSIAAEYRSRRAVYASGTHLARQCP